VGSGRDPAAGIDELSSGIRTIGWVEERNKAFLDFLKVIVETRLHAAVAQEKKRSVFPAGGFTVEVSLNQDSQDALGAALVVIVYRGQLFWLKAGVKAKFLPQLGVKCPFLVVTRLEACKDPALALRVGKPDDDSLMKSGSAPRLLKSSTTILLTIIISDQEDTFHRRPSGFDQCKCPSSLLGIEIGGLTADEPTRANPRFFRQILHATPGQERFVARMSIVSPVMFQHLRLDPSDRLAKNAIRESR
jgi:hypothetical protein